MEFSAEIRVIRLTTVIMTRTARHGRQNKTFYYERVRAPTVQTTKMIKM